MEGKAYTLSSRPDLGELEVYKYPDRKNVSLCITKGSVSYVLAYFRSEERAKDFMEWMGAVAVKGEGEHA